MPLDELVLISFRSELRKEASFADVVSKAAPRLKNIGSLGGVGAATGALGGAGIGALKSYHDARAGGASMGQAALGGVGGALHGAGTGAAIGALAGGIGGARIKSDLSGLSQLSGVAGAGSRFGQRQVHSVTGMLSPAELEGVRGGAYDARKGLQGIQAKLQGPLSKAEAPKAIKALQKSLRGVDASEKAQNMGLTSVPGYLRAVKEHGVGKVLSTGLKEQVTNASPAMAGMMVGMPAIAAGHALLSKGETDTSGRGRGERVGEEVGKAVGGVAGGMMPLAGQLAVGGALGAAGKAVGKGVDRLRGKGQPALTPSTLEPTESQNVPSERIMSPNAAGQRSEIF